MNFIILYLYNRRFESFGGITKTMINKKENRGRKIGAWSKRKFSSKEKRGNGPTMSDCKHLKDTPIVAKYTHTRYTALFSAARKKAE